MQPLRECGRGLGRKGVGQELGGDLGAGPRPKGLVDFSGEAGKWGPQGRGLGRERRVGTRLSSWSPEGDS